MKNTFEEVKSLSDGNLIPVLGLGTWFIDDDQAPEAVKAAIQLGYRHIDTAEAYGNEAGVGKGIMTSGVPREEIFLTTKLAAEAKDYDTAAKMIDESLEKLGTGYIDLMIIHSPQPWNDFRGADYKEGNLAAWRALEDAQKAGKVRSIGVSNFKVEDLENILQNGTVKPAVNQVLMHIGQVPTEIIDFCQANDIAVEAYSPVAHGEILKREDVKEMADKYSVSVPQLCIRYDLQKGAVALPKTANPDHMKQNADLDFVISDEDMEILDQLTPPEDYGEYSVFPVFSGK